MKRKKISSELIFNYYLLSKLLGILGSSINQKIQALVPAEADREPIQDNSAANIFHTSFLLHFHTNYKIHYKPYNYCMVTETSYRLKDGSSTWHQLVQTSHM